MIPQADILAWRTVHPWVTNAQVEQDLIISRAMVDLFAHPDLKGRLAMRGGTAMHKLYLAPATRYSEDIDLVQTQAGPIGEVLNAMRVVLDPWLGEPSWERKANDVKLVYRVESEIAPVVKLRLKIEINTREHEALAGHVGQPFDVRSRWFTGTAEIQTFSLDELLGTKMRALYQRRKGRDLYDLWLALSGGLADPVSVVALFRKYTSGLNPEITREEYSRNLGEKIRNAGFLSDVPPLLRPGLGYDAAKAHRLVEEELIARL
jgi:predicted nucleotidyltransferase component of viral defense system